MQSIKELYEKQRYTSALLLGCIYGVGTFLKKFISPPSWVLMLTINTYHPITHSPRLGFQPAGTVIQSNKNKYKKAIALKPSGCE
jgi:hypothetical protein